MSDIKFGSYRKTLLKNSFFKSGTQFRLFSTRWIFWNNSIVTPRARSYVLCIHWNLFLIIWYWSFEFYNIVNVNYIFSKLLNLFLISNGKGNSINLSFYRSWETHSHHDTRSPRSIFYVHFCNFLISYMIKIIYFAFGRLFRISHILVQKWNFLFSIVFFKII